MPRVGAPLGPAPAAITVAGMQTQPSAHEADHLRLPQIPTPDTMSAAERAESEARANRRFAIVYPHLASLLAR